MQNLSAESWNNRYLQNNTGWDIGYASPALVQYAQQIENKGIAILIPGCGNAYEVEALLSLGFNNITVLDFAEKAFDKLKNSQHLAIKQSNLKLICIDFFEHNAYYDLILEQTFFCALNPNLRSTYAKKMHSLLEPKGKLVGVYFNFPLTEAGPPFGGSLEEYKTYFEPYFNIKTFEACYNSIKPRKGRELFGIMEKV